MKRRMIFGVAVLVMILMTGDLYCATYDLTGTWNYTLSDNWAYGGINCNPGPDASGTCVIEQTGDTFSFAFTSGVVCSPAESCTFEGTVSGAVYTASTTDIVDNENGSVTSTISFTAESSTAASGSGTSRYTHPSGKWECNWGNTLTLTRADDGQPVTRYSLTVNTIGEGTVALDPPGGAYDPGTVVQLTATADPGWQFFSWTGDAADDGAASTTVNMDADKTVTAIFVDSGASEAIDGGYRVTADLWARSVLEVQGQPVVLVWKMVGADITPSGDQVISGYFYADPDDFAYGSPYNPEVFVKIYIAKSGWCNIAYNHVTVDDVVVSSAFNYAGSADQDGAVTLNDRLAEHTYTGVPVDSSLTQAGIEPPASSAIAGGYTLASALWAGSVLQVATDPVTPVDLIWKEVGTDTTPSGARVISGYFYADPADFSYGSVYNPEVFVKVYIDPSGWCNMAFNHVTVDPVTIDSAFQYAGSAQQSGSVTLDGRLLEHQYNGVPVQ